MLPLLLLLVYAVEVLARTKPNPERKDTGTTCRSCGRKTSVNADATAGNKCAGCHRLLVG